MIGHLPNCQFWAHPEDCDCGARIEVGTVLLIRHASYCRQVPCETLARRVIEVSRGGIDYPTVRLECTGCGEISLLAESSAREMHRNNRGDKIRMNLKRSHY